MQSPQLRSGGLSNPRARIAGFADLVSPAGKAWPANMHCPIAPSPRTPERGALTERHRRRTQPGEMTVHWGLKSVSVPEPDQGYGLKATGGETVQQNFKSGQKSGVAEYRDTVGEAVYRSTSREPLGHGWVRGHALPEYTNSPGFQGFGRPSERCRPAKEVISPRGVYPESEEVRAQYRRSHGSVEGGEVLTRNYNFPSAATDPKFRFGSETAKDSSHQGHGVKAALSMDAGGEHHSVPSVVVGPLAVEHFRQATSNHLASPKNLCMKGGDRNVPEDASTCGEVIRGRYPVDEQLPDRDLGRCIVEGRRNFLTRDPFGVPSVRTDRVAPPVEKRSIANFTNWGDCTGAVGVLSPGRLGTSGLEVSDFQAGRTFGELQDIFKGAGLSPFPPEVFQAACATGDEGSGDVGKPTASVEAVMAACADWSASSVAMPVAF